MLVIIPTKSLLPSNISLWGIRLILDNKLNEAENEGVPFVRFNRVDQNFFAQNSFWMLVIISTKSLLPVKYITLGH
jgi:hypothetical protein